VTTRKLNPACKPNLMLFMGVHDYDTGDILSAIVTLAVEQYGSGPVMNVLERFVDELVTYTIEQQEPTP